MRVSLFALLFFPASLTAAESLVEIREVDGTIQVTQDKCLLMRPVADGLARVQSSLRLRSVKLMLRDCPGGTTVAAFLVNDSGEEVGLPQVPNPKMRSSQRKRAAKQTAFLNLLMTKEGFEPDPKVAWQFEYKK